MCVGSFDTKSSYGDVFFVVSVPTPVPKDRAPVPAPVPAANYRNALISLRDDVFSQHTNWKTYYVNDASHTFNLIPGMFTKEVGGVRLVDWINDLRDGTATHVSD